MADAKDNERRIQNMKRVHAIRRLARVTPIETLSERIAAIAEIAQGTRASADDSTRKRRGGFDRMERAGLDRAQ